GSGNFSFVIRGRSAHAGRNPQDGRNAVTAAAELALHLEGLPVRFPGLSVNAARIDGGSPNNVVPDLAILRVNLRPATPELEAEARKSIEWFTERLHLDRDVEVALHGGFGRPPKPLTSEAEALFNLVKQAGSDLGQSIAWQPS